MNSTLSVRTAQFLLASCGNVTVPSTRHTRTADAIYLNGNILSLEGDGARFAEAVVDRVRGCEGRSLHVQGPRTVQVQRHHPFGQSGPAVIQDMPRHPLRRILSFVASLIIVTAAMAQDDGGKGEAAANATNPLAFVTKLQFQPNFTWKDAGGEQLSLVSRIIMPTKTIGLPFIKSKDPDKVYTIYRLEFPLISQTYAPESPANATGMGDMILLDAIAFKKAWGLIGVGPAVILPTGSPNVLTGGKLDVGPVAVVLYTKIKGLQLGALAQQFFSVATEIEGPDHNFMLFQPIINKIMGGGYFLQLSPIMKFDWVNEQYSVPLSLGFGKAFAKNLSMNIAPQYVVSGPGQGDFTLQVNINTMFAPTK